MPSQTQRKLRSNCRPTRIVRRPGRTASRPSRREIRLPIRNRSLSTSSPIPPGLLTASFTNSFLASERAEDQATKMIQPTRASGKTAPRRKQMMVEVIAGPCDGENGYLASAYSNRTTIRGTLLPDRYASHFGLYLRIVRVARSPRSCIGQSVIRSSSSANPKSSSGPATRPRTDMPAA